MLITFTPPTVKVITYQAFGFSMTTDLATGKEQKPDWHKWLRPDRLQNANTRKTITNYIAHLRTTAIPIRYTYTIQQLLVHSNKTAPQLTIEDYARFMDYLVTNRSAQDAYLEQVLAALRYHLRLTGNEHLVSSLGLPESRQYAPVVADLTPEQETIYAACADYIAHQEAHRFTKPTVKNTRSILRNTIHITGKHPRAWTTLDATIILAAWNARGLKGQTINTNVNRLRPMLRHYGNYTKNDANTPFGDWTAFPEDDPFRQWPNPEQIATILRTANEDPRAWVRMGMHVLAFTCLRRTTCVQLRNDNIKLETSRIVTKSKGGKTLRIPINRPYLLPLLRNALTTSTGEHIIARDDGSPIKSDALWRACRAITRRATGIAFRPHDLRRGMARWIYYASDKDLVLTRDFLGHDSLDTTSKYLGLSDEELSTNYDAITSKLVLPGAGPPALQSGPIYIPRKAPPQDATEPPTP